MKKTSLFVFLVVAWFGFNFARANEAVGELTEANIEQALAARESKAPAAEAAPAVPVQESEIPVQLDTKKSTASENSPFVKMMMGLIIVSGLAGASWLALRRYKLTNKGANSATQMKILAQHHLGPKKSLAIVRVAGESVLVGITDHHISLIKSLSLLDEDIPEDAPKSFSKAFDKATAVEKTAAEDSDEFSISGIKDLVSSRLKNMRSFE